jgi:alpha-tubulin suppressor-like RCC1 family protein
MWSTPIRSVPIPAARTARIVLIGFLLIGLALNAFASLPSAAAATPGAVAAWGDNRSNQLGLTPTTAQRATPGAVTAAVNGGITAIAAGGAYSVALKADGSVLTWGSNFPSGQLGQGSTEDRLDPGPVQGLSGATAIAAGRTHALAVAGGNVYAWGNNGLGQLGTSTATNCNSGPCSRTAIRVGTLTNAKAVGAGANHSLVVLGDGTAFAWGLNSSGELGDGSTTQRNAPVQVQGVGGTGVLTGIVALKNDGTLYSWGQNAQGQLGIGSQDTLAHSAPIVVPGLTNIVAIAAGYRHSLALRSDGTVFAWGSNESGQLGNGATTTGGCSCVNTPAAVAGVGGAIAIGAGELHSMAVLQDGTVRAWGANGSTQIGVTAPAVVTTATTVPGLAGAVAVAGGSGHSVAVRVTPQFALSVATDGTGTGTVTPGSGGYDAGSQVSLTAQATNNAVFTGWTVDGAFAGWQSPLTVTMDRDHSVTATFSKAPSFCDVNAGDRYYDAIRQLAARGVIRGITQDDGTLCFAPRENTKRAQMAALIARPLGWDLEDHGNGFSDQGAVDGNLWRNVGALAFYNVARGYKAETCAALGVAAPCYGPTDEVLYAQVISFITRGMVAKGYWTQQPEDASLYPNIPTDSGHRQDLTTYVHYAGALPDTSDAHAPWAGWDRPAPRGWFAEAEWRALNSYFGLK